MLEQIDHVNIVVSDLKRSVCFYTEVLGLEETRRAHLEGAWIESVAALPGVQADVAYVQPRGGGPRIELIQYTSPPGAEIPESGLANTVGLRHIAFRVRDMAAAYARLEAAGVVFFSAPIGVPNEVVQHDAGEKRLCYFRDPDGVLLELAEYR